MIKTIALLIFVTIVSAIVPAIVIAVYKFVDACVPDYYAELAKFLDIPINQNDRNISIMPYNNCTAVPNTVQFIDEGYLHRCKDGTKDLRFNNNPYIKEHYNIVIKTNIRMYMISIYDNDTYRIIKDAIIKKGIRLQEI